MTPKQRIETFLATRSSEATTGSQVQAKPPMEPSRLTAEQFAEAKRLAGELVKLHKAGAIKSEHDAVFYAALLKVFQAAVWPERRQEKFSQHSANSAAENVVVAP